MTLRIRLKNAFAMFAKNSENTVVAQGSKDITDNTLIIPDTPYEVKDQDDNVLASGNLVSCKEDQVISVTVDGTVAAEIKDRWGLQMPNVNVDSGSPAVNFNTYDFTPLALSRETSWGGFDTDLQTASTSLITADVWKKLITWLPIAGGTAGCHRWNFKYPFDDNRAHRMLFTGLTHNSLGLDGFDGFHWAFSNVNVQSFTNTYDFAVGVTLTSDLGTALGVTKNILHAEELTGMSASLSINTTTGAITYGLFNGTATYSPGSPEADYTGFRYVVKREGTSLKLFINGSLVQTTTPTFSLHVSGYTINSTIRFGGQGSANLALESTIGNIYMASDLSDAEVATIDGIIDTLETALGR